MFTDSPFFPPVASTSAGRVDALFLFLVGVSVFFTVLIAALLVFFAIRYRRRAGGPPVEQIHGSTALEMIWTLIPLGIAMVMFVWGAVVFFHLSRPPDDTVNVNVVGKRWMWKLQHMTGRREINELHVPVGRAIRLNMTSEDVIHSFFVPAFRIKADVLPGRYSTVWFRPTKPGRYHLFCAEYCGTEHSGMIGSIVVMEPADFQTWLAGGPQEVSLATAGEKAFRNLGCATCHSPDSKGRGPALDRLFGGAVRLTGGSTVTADEDYVRESILNPNAKVVDGYQSVMPTFQGLVNEEGILQLIEYIKSLRPAEEAVPEGASVPAGREGGS